jgi:hypothetical protein
MEGLSGMKTLIGLVGAFLLLPAAAVFAADEWDKALQQQIDLMDELNTILKTVKDKETSKTAVTKLKKVKVKIMALSKKMSKFEKPSKEKGDELKKKYAPKLMAAGKTLQKETARIKDVPGGQDVLDALK